MEADASPSDPELRHIFSPPGLEDKLGQLGDPAKRRAAFEALRRAALEGVDARVSERAEELWARGKQMLSQIQLKHKESSAKLSEEVTRCCEAQRTLEAENEKLKEALRGLAARLSVLAPPREPGEALMCSPGATTASSCTPQQSKVSFDAASTGPFTPGSGDTFGSHLLCTPSEAAGAGPECKLPEVPRFPFPAQPQSPGAPLSLAEALGTQTPHRTPLSLVNSLTPTPLPEVAPAFMPHSAASNAMFSFTLRKADGADLGLNVSHHERDRVLRVEGLRPDGAVEAWNRQCAGGACAEKAVLKGDQIISVNSIAYDPAKMLEECRDKQLLRLTIVRSNQAWAPPGAGAPGRCALRADARAFAPAAGDVAGDQDRQASGDDPASAVQNAEGTPERL